MPESLPVVCPQVERRFFLGAIEFLQSGKDFGSGNRNQGCTVAEDGGQQAEFFAGLAK